MRIRRLVAVAGAVVVLGSVLVSCSELSGSGTIVSQGRDIHGFDSVAVRDGLRVELAVGSSASHSVLVRYDDNVLDHLITRLHGSTLIVELAREVSFSKERDRAIEVVIPHLDVLNATEGSTVEATGLADASYSIVATRGSHVDATALPAIEVDVEASGGASIALLASGAVTGSASDGATISISGNPPMVDIEISGGANISP